MTNIAIIDIDGIIADNQEREQKANITVERAINGLDRYLDAKKIEDIAKSIFYHKDVFYDSVMQDILIDGAKDALDLLKMQRYTLIGLTSRPEYLRIDTLIWLRNQGVDLYDLICKNEGFQYTKTASFKRGMVQTIARLTRAEMVIYIDDDQKNIDEVLKDSCNDDYYINVYTSLLEATRESGTLAKRAEQM